MLRHQAQVMEILIRISQAMDLAEATNAAQIAIPTTLINRRQMWHRHQARQHRDCFWSMKCICATHSPREWTRNHIACTHLKLSYHKVWKIWVISKLPDRPMIVNWCLYSFRFCFQKFFFYSWRFQNFTRAIVHHNEKLFVHFRRIGWKSTGNTTFSLSNQTT